MTEFTETTSLRKLAYLYSLTFDEYKNYSKTSDKTINDKKDSYNRMRKYCEEMINNNGSITRIYPDVKYGRRFGKGAIWTLSSRIRNFLFNDNTTDLDMKNAQPTLLLWLCKKYNLPHTELEFYCKNRDYILSKGDKETIKKNYIMCITSNKEIKTKDKSLLAFDKEIKDNVNKLIALKDFQYIVNDIPDDKDNLYGSAISRILGTYENKVLEKMIEFCNIKNIEICALIFDGLLMYGNHYNNTIFLTELEEYVNDKFDGLNIKFDFKQQISNIIIPDNFQVTNKNPTSYDECKNYEQYKYLFELSHCRIINRNTTFKIIINPTDNSIEEFLTFKENELHSCYKHLNYDIIDPKGNTKKEYFIKKWLEDKSARIYEDIGCYPPPLDTPKNYFNTWIPFRMETINITINEEDEEYVNKGALTLAEHFKILCNRDETIWKYLFDWIGQALIYPSIKTTAPCLISKEGSGKGTIIKILKKLMGDKKVLETSDPAKYIWGDFNELMLNAFFISLNEMEQKQQQDAEGKIKNLITDGDLVINGKGKSHLPIKSYHRFWYSSNNQVPIKSSEGDRRNLIIKCSDELKGNSAYFTKINEYIEDDRIIYRFYEALINRKNLDSFNKKPIPITEYQLAIQQANRDPIDLFMEQFVRNNADNGSLELKAITMYECFNSWKQENGIKYEANSIKLNRNILLLGLPNDSIVTASKDKNLKKRDGNWIRFDFNQLKEYYHIE
jgi:hypothetical protein